MPLVPLTALLLVAATRLHAQGHFPPDSLVNTSVIPKATPIPQVLAMMRGFTAALGVRCTHCHVGSDDRPLTEYNFASDDKPAKGVARAMMRMLKVVNEEHLGQLKGEAGRPRDLRVSCETCHRGLARPIPIDRLLDSALVVSVDSAAALYRALYSRARERGSYDLSDAPLNAIVQRLAARGRGSDALVIAKLNEDVHPSSAMAPFFRGEVLLLQRDTTSAIAAYRLSLERDPASPARQRLAQLRAP